MLAASCCASRVGVNRAIGQGQRRPSLQPRQAGCRRPSRHPALRPLAFREQNGSGSALQATPDQIHATKMINLATEYFSELMTNGDAEACHRLLSPRVEHKDMVRNEGRYGISEYQRFVRDLKAAYPRIYVTPTQFGVVDRNTLFVAFEGRATEHTPLFKGVDLFYFNDDASKIEEVEVYRSNWLGAAGHKERKRAAQQGRQGQQDQPHMAT